MLNPSNRPRDVGILSSARSIDLQAHSFAPHKNTPPVSRECSTEEVSKRGGDQDHSHVSSQSESRYRSAMMTLNLKLAVAHVARFTILAAATTIALPYAISVLPIQVALPLLGLATLKIANKEGFFEWRIESGVAGDVAVSGDKEDLDRIKDIASPLASAAGVVVPHIRLEEDNLNATMRDYLILPKVLSIGRPLLEELDDEQMRGVIAHEIAHCNRSHTKISSMSRILAHLSVDSAIFGAFALTSNAVELWCGSAGSVVLGVCAALSASTALKFSLWSISAFIERMNEFKTDLRSAHYLGGNPTPLMRALQSLQPTIFEKINPQGHGSRWFHTHPTTQQRCAMLEAVFGPESER